MADVLEANKYISAEDKSNAKVIRTLMNSHLNQDSYPIRTAKALIINNIEFEPQLNLVEREGSDIDASNLFQSFQELGFDCDLLNCATDEEIVDKFNEIKADKNNLRIIDCLVVVVLSHGDEDCIYAANTKMKIKSIMEEFNAENCPELILKPKMFIFETSAACRRDQNGRGVNVKIIRDPVFLQFPEPSDIPNEADFDEYYLFLQDKRLCIPDEADFDERFLQDKRLCIPNEADFLAVYSTLPGHVSFRNNQRGCIFSRILSEELLKMKKGEDIYKVLLRVNRKVGNYKSTNIQLCNYTQMPYFVSHLTKELILKQW